MRTHNIRGISAALGLMAGLLVLSGRTEAACLMKLSPGTRMATLIVAVPESEASDYVAKGYKRGTCPKNMGPLRAALRKSCENFDLEAVRAKAETAAAGKENEGICKSAKNEADGK